MLMGSSSRSPAAVGDTPGSPKYSDRLSPAINNYLSEASRQEFRVGSILFMLCFTRVCAVGERKRGGGGGMGVSNLAEFLIVSLNYFSCV